MSSSRIWRATSVYDILFGRTVLPSVVHCVSGVPGLVVNVVPGYHHPGWKSLPSTVKAFSTSADKPIVFDVAGNEFGTLKAALGEYTDSYPDGRPVYFAVKDKAGLWGVEPKEVNRETSEFLGTDPEWSTVAHAHSGFPVRFYSSERQADKAIEKIEAEEAKAESSVWKQCRLVQKEAPTKFLPRQVALVPDPKKHVSGEGGGGGSSRTEFLMRIANYTASCLDTVLVRIANSAFRFGDAKKNWFAFIGGTGSGKTATALHVVAKLRKLSEGKKGVEFAPVYLNGQRMKIMTSYEASTVIASSIAFQLGDVLGSAAGTTLHSMEELVEELESYCKAKGTKLAVVVHIDEFQQCPEATLELVSGAGDVMKNRHLSITPVFSGLSLHENTDLVAGYKQGSSVYLGKSYLLQPFTIEESKELIKQHMNGSKTKTKAGYPEIDDNHLAIMAGLSGGVARFAVWMGEDMAIREPIWRSQEVCAKAIMDVQHRSREYYVEKFVEDLVDKKRGTDHRALFVARSLIRHDIEDGWFNGKTYSQLFEKGLLFVSDGRISSPLVLLAAASESLQKFGVYGPLLNPFIGDSVYLNSVSFEVRVMEAVMNRLNCFQELALTEAKMKEEKRAKKTIALSEDHVDGGEACFSLRTALGSDIKGAICTVQNDLDLAFTVAHDAHLYKHDATELPPKTMPDLRAMEERTSHLAGPKSPSADGFIKLDSCTYVMVQVKLSDSEDQEETWKFITTEAVKALGVDRAVANGWCSEEIGKAFYEKSKSKSEKKKAKKDRSESKISEAGASDESDPMTKELKDKGVDNNKPKPTILGPKNRKPGDPIKRKSGVSMTEILETLGVDNTVFMIVTNRFIRQVPRAEDLPKNFVLIDSEGFQEFFGQLLRFEVKLKLTEEAEEADSAREFIEPYFQQTEHEKFTNVNTAADAEALMVIPGVGETNAGAILEALEKGGPFSGPADLVDRCPKVPLETLRYMGFSDEKGSSSK